MKNNRLMVVCVLTLVATSSLSQAQRRLKYSRNNNAVEAAFRDSIAKARNSVVEVFSDGKLVSLGMAVTADGYLVTKFSELGNEVACKIGDKPMDANVIGVFGQDDVALLKVDAKLQPIEFDDSPVRVGSWLTTPGKSADPLAIGVVSVAVRELEKLPWDWDRGFMGISLDRFNPVIGAVTPDSPASRAGLRERDRIVRVDDLEVSSGNQFIDYMKKKKLGESVTLKMKRNDREFDRTVRLGHFPGINVEQNRLGGKLSSRKNGFRRVFQHDTIIKPSECGGPVVNVDGKVVGMNISRTGRVETFALPIDAVQEIVAKLMPKKEVKNDKSEGEVKVKLPAKSDK